MIFTFYSYKGGVGRSLALAHVAYAFAERGLRILAVDFDLEAPGLERYCFGADEGVQAAREHVGLVDLILDYRRALTSPEAFEKRSFREWGQFIVSVRDPVNDRGGRLDLMTAGRRGSHEHLRDYSLTVRTFDWPDFFHNWNGEGFFKWLRDEWKRPDVGYDVVLVDSRTGVTEMGGVCAYQLADVAVLLCAPNYQNLDGTFDVMRDFRSPGVVALRGDRPLQLLAIPTRLEPKHPGRDEFLDDFAERLGRPPFGPEVPVSYADLALPYLPQFAVSEPVVGGPYGAASQAEREAFATLTGALSKLADALTLFATPGSRLDQDRAAALAALRGESREQAVELEADTSRRSAGYDFFIDYGVEDAACAQELSDVLRAANFEVFIDTTSLAAGSTWGAEIERAIDYSASVLVCFGVSSTSGVRKELLLRIRNSRRDVPLIPVILPGGNETAPHSFGLETSVHVDLRSGVGAAADRLTELRRPRAEPAAPVDAPSHVNPYRATEPYGQDDVRFFFGREDELLRVLAQLDEAHVVWIEGAAKVGKTSLVMAGVLPALRTRATHDAPAPRMSVHDGSDPADWPDLAVPAAGNGDASSLSPEVIVIDHIDSFAEGSSHAARRARRVQLEALLSGVTAKRQLILIGRGVGLDDDEGDPNAFSGVLQSVPRFVLKRLNGTALRRAITEPAQKSGHLLENGLCERLMEGAGEAHGAMLQVQLALVALWDLRRDGWLTNRALDGLDQLAGVYGRHLRARLAALDESQRIAASVLFKTLCQLEPTSGALISVAASWAQTRTPLALRSVGAEALRDLLANEGIIDLWSEDTLDGGVRHLRVALARADARAYFDAAAASADRGFMAWRGRLGSSLLHWQQGGRQPTALLADSALETAAHWHRQRGEELTAAERDYVEASIDALRLRSPSQDGAPPEILAPSEAVSADAHEALLQVSVLNADLRFVSGALMLGHYRSLRLTGTELVADFQLARVLTKRLSAGLYPDAPGSSAVVDNKVPDPDNVLAMARPAAVVVVGLGDEGRLRSVDLVASVRQAVLTFLERQREQQPRSGEVSLSSTLMGSGAVGVSTGSCAQLIVRGVREANGQAAAAGMPTIDHLQFVEIYHDRACEAWRALRHQTLGQLTAMQLAPGVNSGAGALRRALASSYRGRVHDIVTVLIAPGDPPSIAFTVDTRRTSGEVRAQAVLKSLVRELVTKGSNSAVADVQIGRTLFDLLIPVEVEPFLAGTNEMVIELDAGTASLPWELVDIGEVRTSDPRPWAVRTKLLRKLRTAEFRTRVSERAAIDHVLVVGEPMVDHLLYPPVPGARAEAVAVAKRLTSGAAGLPAANVRALTTGNDDAQNIINALYERPYRVVHLAGHGAPGPDGGLVLSGGTFLGAAEVQAMRAIPELVFVNCCHLAARDAQELLAPYDRVSFAASIAETLITIGVRCVVAAGWSVGDKPAEIFATTFYDTLLGGGRFIDAVGEARSAAWRADGIGPTWAAYQCYGDPEWTFRAANDAQRPSLAVSDEFVDVASPVDLAVALETIATRLRFGADGYRTRRAVEDASLGKIRFLEQKFAPLWGRMGAVAEAFGLAYSASRDAEQGIAWYRVAVGAEDGSASLRATEELGNQLARRGESRSDAAAGRRDLEEAIAWLSKLVEIQPTVEREALLGSAYKRLAMLEGREAERPARRGRDPRSRAKSASAKDRLDALRKMALHYGNAERLARELHADYLFYPAKNAISAELRLAFLERRPVELATDRMRAVQDSLARAATERPDFWSVVGQIELRVLVAVAAQQLAGESAALIASFTDLKARVPAPTMWDSVHSEARFTLEPYLSVASAAEQRAARALLDALAAMAAA